MYLAALVPPSMSTTKLVVTLASFKDPIGEKIAWGVDRWRGFLEGPWWLHPKLQGGDVEVHSRVPVLKQVVPGAMVDAHSIKGTLTYSLPNGAPPWDSAACLGIASHKYQKWVTSRVCRIHITV